MIDQSTRAVHGPMRAIAALFATLVLAGCLSSAGPAVPTIRTQPANRTGFATQTVTFDVGAVGEPTLTFQWYRDGSPISGATGFTYTTDALLLSDSGAKFKVRISNGAGSVTSDEATLTVNPPPTITASPVAVTVDAGGSASFTVAASGESLSYQWLRDDVAISGATSATYTLSSTVAADDGASISALVANPAGSVESGKVLLTVRATPAVTVQPLGQTVAVGEPAVFGVTATGGELAYQWQRNGVNVAGATSRVYVLAAAAAGDDNASYTVTVTNPRGQATSSAAVLRVQARSVAALPALPAQLALSKGSTAAASFTYVRRQDGTVASWGYNSEGERGDGTSGSANDAIGTVTLPAGRTARAIAAGTSNALVLLDNGDVYGWGLNSFGELGLGDQVARLTPTRITLARPAVAIAMGANFGLAALDDGRVFAWGTNGAGQLARVDRAASLVPVEVAGITGVVSVAAGNTHALALRSDGSVWGWGSNAAGQLGNGTFKGARVPVNTGLAQIARIRAGGDLSLAISQRGVAYAWGENSGGQLGLGSGNVLDVGVPLAVLLDARDGDASDTLLLVLGTDGIVRSAGTNETGSLGDGTTTARPSFAAVNGVSGAVAVGAGGRTFAAAIRSDGTTYIWGDNSSKQFGNSAVSSSGTGTPTAVPSFDAIP